MEYSTFTFDDFTSRFPVPRETLQKLESFIALLLKWQKSINLISPNSIADVWERHVIDSYQLYGFLQSGDAVVDLGSGGGFPGIILAIAGIKNITLVESDNRKSVFLKEAIRLLALGASVVTERVEACHFSTPVVFTCRAFSRINVILQMLGATLIPGTKLLLLKGKSYKSELDEASERYLFDCAVHPSITDQEGVVLELTYLNTKEESHG